MNLKEKINDIVMVAKNDRRVMAGGALLFIAVLIVFSSSDSNSNRRFKADTNKPKTNQFGSEDASKDLMGAFHGTLKELEEREANLAQATERLKAEFEGNAKSTAQILEQAVSKMTDLNKEIEILKEQIQNQKTERVEVEPVEHEINETAEMRIFGELDTDLPPEPIPPVPRKAVFISPGDAVPVELLTGVNAPVDGTPYPVIFRLSGPISGPDGSILDLGEARIIAAAQGSEVDSRVLFRLTNLSMRHNDGRRSTMSIDGWIVGEDGVRGLKGKLIDKLGSLIAATATGSFAGAFADNAINGNSVDVDNSSGVNISGDALENSAADGVGAGMQKLVDVLIDRYESLVPVVEILSRRQAVAVFSQPVEVTECENGDCNSEEQIYGSFVD